MVEITISNPVGASTSKDSTLTVHITPNTEYGNYISFACIQENQKYAATKNGDVISCTLQPPGHQISNISIIAISHPDNYEFLFSNQNVSFVWMDDLQLQSIYPFAQKYSGGETITTVATLTTVKEVLTNEGLLCNVIPPNGESYFVPAITTGIQTDCEVTTTNVLEFYELVNVEIWWNTSRNTNYGNGELIQISKNGTIIYFKGNLFWRNINIHKRTHCPFTE